MRHTYQDEQWLPYPVELVFAFFAYPENLPRLMPAWQKARIEEAAFATPPPRPVAVNPELRFNSIAAGIGTRLTLSFRPFPFAPIRVPWEAEITEFVWNDHFCDRQLRGPFAYWNHCHRVRAETRASESGGPVHGTLVQDEIEYQMRMGPLGELAHSLVAKKQIKAIFRYRHQRTAELLPRMAQAVQSSISKVNQA